MSRRACVAGLAGLAGLAALGAPGVALSADAPTIPGPDPHPSKPRFRLPRGSVDTHTHIFGPAAQYPYATERTYTPPDAGLAAFNALHRAIGVDRAVIINASIYGGDNRVITDAIAHSRGRYLGVANVEASMSDAHLRELDRAGIRGARFTFVRRLNGLTDLSGFQAMVARIAQLGWHADLYLERGTIREFTPVLRALPVPYVLDHMASITAAGGVDQPDFKALLELQASDPHCWIKITGPERVSVTGAPFLDAVPFAQRLVANAPDRVLWGTDWPHPNVPTIPNDGALVDLIPLYAPDVRVQRQLLVDNPARLFRFA